ncbi:MAG: hypothetical protein ABI810_06575 [Sphingomonas bacterium]
MTFDVAAVFADAWRMWKRDRELLLVVTGLFLFLPELVRAIYVPALPVPTGSSGDAAALKSWLAALELWSSQYSLIVIAIALAAMFGTLMVFTLYLDPRRPNVRVALVRALTLLPRYLGVTLLLAFPLGIALLTLWLLLPAIYAAGRLILVTPSLVADRPNGVFGAISRSLSLTRGYGMVLAGFACIAAFGGGILSLPFRALGAALDGAPMANPVVALLLDTGMAAGMAIGALGAILVEIALYRRLAASKGI